MAARPTLDDRGEHLARVTFVVVDVETTGGSPTDCAITEIGAVKLRGGEVLGEFSTLVAPRAPIPPGVAALTGITDGMVADRPPAEAVLPAFLEFCRGGVLVAHNARFDLAFLNTNLARLGYPRLSNPVVCTAALARRLVRDEVRDLRLATLAALFRCRTVPVHRALPDARATVEVLHGLLERAGSFGVLTLEDLVAFTRVRDAPLFRARRGLADGLPRAPGVYAFRSASDEILYVGKATDLRARVRSYFGADDRRKVVDLLKEAAVVDHLVCPTPLEAAVREVRLIHAHRPRFNRRSATPERGVYLALTVERFPRLSVVRRPRGRGAVLGPVGSRRTAELVADALTEISALRRCTPRMGPRTRLPACALKELGRCLAPCDGTVDPEGYAPAVAAVQQAMTGDVGTAVAHLEARMRTLAAEGRYERAAVVRDRLRALVAAVARTRRTAALAGVEEVVASRPVRGGRAHEVVLARAGRLVATATCAPEALDRTVLELGPDEPVLGAAPPRDPRAAVLPDEVEEVELLARWLDGEGVRLHACTGVLASRVTGGGVLAEQRGRLAARGRTTGRPEAELDAKRTRRSSLAP